MVKKRKKKESCTIDTLWGDRLREESANGLLAFTSGRDVRPTPPYDERLIPYDIWGSKAHAIMLWKQNIISRDEAETLVRGLKEVETLYTKGTFIVDPAKEDVHSTIETYLIEHYGMESAGRLHTGRSRNDQIVLDLRLYMRAEVMDFVMLLISLIDTMILIAKDHRDAIMPGYTHHQPGMIGSWGHLLFSFALPLERDIITIPWVEQQAMARDFPWTGSLPPGSWVLTACTGARLIPCTTAGSRSRNWAMLSPSR
jgi:argininosuccinate lyase